MVRSVHHSRYLRGCVKSLESVFFSHLCPRIRRIPIFENTFESHLQPCHPHLFIKTEFLSRRMHRKEKKKKKENKCLVFLLSVLREIQPNAFTNSPSQRRASAVIQWLSELSNSTHPSLGALCYVLTLIVAFCSLTPLNLNAWQTLRPFRRHVFWLSLARC